MAEVTLYKPGKTHKKEICLILCKQCYVKLMIPHDLLISLLAMSTCILVLKKNVTQSWDSVSDIQMLLSYKNNLFISKISCKLCK